MKIPFEKELSEESWKLFQNFIIKQSNEDFVNSRKNNIQTNHGNSNQNNTNNQSTDNNSNKSNTNYNNYQFETPKGDF